MATQPQMAVIETLRAFGTLIQDEDQQVFLIRATYPGEAFDVDIDNPDELDDFLDSRGIKKRWVLISNMIDDHLIEPVDDRQEAPRKFRLTDQGREAKLNRRKSTNAKRAPTWSIYMGMPPVREKRIGKIANIADKLGCRSASELMCKIADGNLKVVPAK